MAFVPPVKYLRKLHCHLRKKIISRPRSLLAQDPSVPQFRDEGEETAQLQSTVDREQTGSLVSCTLGMPVAGLWEHCPQSLNHGNGNPALSGSDVAMRISSDPWRRLGS